ncbi:CaiB/BaiF CoA-transferase family protein [Sporosarcina pasteurii]|uniref:Formyl-coenzyme A transferase n=1 Tax=Sporosarcina pasteurii TaxID=1474 RepID=A0A380C689_SPOPA|nr:CaiB/BaiF CoA-transferase family protein [Sporosarcina pasteurii]MDS9473083.1 CaiB/BaiF CoA-transferase family protein [Sporosarcina pasteurii]QBQ04586.1 CoA transferase [Sporosarcina pasteurii]SUJ13985.1 Formyl-coenzyme A transferase [Sporosarcina pasteurii]
MGILQGLKILDFTTLLPGPYATMMFADMGADVIRVESATRTDLVRELPPMDDGESAAHRHLNRSKRSLTLNLKKAASVEIIKSLITEYDIVVEQFRPGVMERLGLDYETLKKVNPKLIYCSITGYGQTGPYQNRPGHDNNFLSLSGLLDYSRRKGERPPTLGFQVADIAGGSMHAVIGILAAALKRQQTGEGEYIDVSMTDAAFSLNALYGPGYLTNGIEPKAEELLLNGGGFYDYYETKDGRYFSVGSLEPAFRKVLCEAIGQPELLNIAMSETVEDQKQFKETLQHIFLSKTFDEWLTIFDEDFEGCVEPILTFSEASRHPQLQAREMIVDVPKENGEYAQQIAFPIKFSSTEPIYKHTGGKLGAHIEEILMEQGIAKEQIEEWKVQGIFN